MVAVTDAEVAKLHPRGVGTTAGMLDTAAARAMVEETVAVTLVVKGEDLVGDPRHL